MSVEMLVLLVAMFRTTETDRKTERKAAKCRAVVIRRARGAEIGLLVNTAVLCLATWNCC
jgi:hypothetical protein